MTEFVNLLKESCEADGLIFFISMDKRITDVFYNCKSFMIFDVVFMFVRSFSILQYYLRKLLFLCSILLCLDERKIVLAIKKAVVNARKNESYE